MTIVHALALGKLVGNFQSLEFALRAFLLNDELAPRIKELKARFDELSKARVQTEADMVVKGVQHVDVEMVKVICPRPTKPAGRSGFYRE